MAPDTEAPIMIRLARPEEYPALGALTVAAYASLPGMPTVAEQPEYYALLRDVAKRASRASLRVFAAIDASGQVLGAVDFIGDMSDYGSGGTASTVRNAAGIRLLAVMPASRGRGVGKRLTEFCIDHARELGRGRVVLHSTRAMQTAWAMYERLGFERFPQLDFQQGQLEVFGFVLTLTRSSPASA